MGSGLATARFCFEGFLPRRQAARLAQLAELRDERRTMVFYESPHRLAPALTDLAAAFGPKRRVVVARELTKLHEQWWRGTLTSAAAWAATESPKGEFVVVVAGAEPPPAPSDDELERGGGRPGDRRLREGRGRRDRRPPGRTAPYGL